MVHIEVVEKRDQRINVIKHYCKVCNRGFGCASALGGHMKTHMTEDLASDNVDQSFAIKTQFANNKHSYFLRAKMPRSFNEFQESDDLDDADYKKLSFGQFASEKSSKSKHENFDNKVPSSNEEEDLANCLVMLSNKSYDLTNNNNEENKAKEDEKGIFQCKACKKVFNSHQALGGHRASHKKVKGCFAAKMDGQENIDQDSVLEQDQDHFSSPSDHYETTKVRKMHECSVCRRVFASGQALGGHKRCHWLTSSTDNTFVPNFHYDPTQQLYKKPMFQKPDFDQLDLSLNLAENTVGRDSNNARIETKRVEENTERACEVKVKKLSDLMDVNLDGGWLKMGLASNSAI